MCKFDLNPLWKNYTEIDEEGSVVFWDKECKGEWQTIYYNFLLSIHIYYMLEFLIRTLVHKYYIKVLMTHDSLIEIFTTVPFIILYLTIDRTGAHRPLQFFIVFDQYRFFIIKRYTKYLDGDI
jgi:hypothetical protein